MKSLVLIFVLLGILFASLIEAQSKRNANVCNLPVDIGPCRARKTRFHYDSTAKQCTKFFYGGCEGNENNFLTKDECAKVCITAF